MKIGVTQIILGTMSLDDTLNLCLDAGYEAVELTFRDGKDLNADLSTSEIESVGEKCRQAGIEIGSVIASYADRGNLLSPDTEERESGVKSLVRNLEIAGILGVSGILLHPGQLTVADTYQSVWDNLISILKRGCADRCAEQSCGWARKCLEQISTESERDARIC